MSTKKIDSFNQIVISQVQLISFQCSPLATADGILKTFKQASSLQKSKDLAKFVSVVVLDEIGLAEDSPRMPLKVQYIINYLLMCLVRMNYISKLDYLHTEYKSCTRAIQKFVDNLIFVFCK